MNTDKKNRLTQIKTRYAFSLMELIVVVIILAILAGLFIPVFLKTIERFKDKEATTALRLIRQAEKIYKYEKNTYYPALGSEGNVTKINSNLKIDLKENDWDYKVTGGGVVFLSYIATATRTSGRCKGRMWIVYYNLAAPLDEPACSGSCCP